MEALLAIPGLTALSDALSAPFTDPGSRTFVPLLLGVVVLISGLALLGSAGARRTVAGLRERSSLLDLQLLVGRQLLRAAGGIPALLSSVWLAQQVVFTLDRLGRPELTGVLPGWVVAAAYSTVLFVAWDASRYVVHRLLHTVPVLWQFHQVHHSAEVLTPLTYHRVHPVESVLYQVRFALVTAAVTGTFFWAFRGAAQPVEILGVHAVGFTLNAIAGNLRHSHVWWSFGALERVLISPAQHQIHHAVGQDHVNHGTWLAIWDQLGGTWQQAGEQPEQYGLTERNHGDHLVSAWLDPFRAVLGLSPVHRPSSATPPARPAAAPAFLEARGSDGTAHPAGNPAAAALRR